MMLHQSKTSAMPTTQDVAQDLVDLCRQSAAA